MMQELFSFVGQALLVAVLLSVLPGKLIADLYKRRIFVLVLLVVCLFVPVYGLAVGQWLRSVVGDPSAITLIIFANILAQRLFNFKLVEAESRNILLPGVAAFGLVFYPMALGVDPFDPYHLGYTPLVMSLLLCVASIFARIRGKRNLAIILLLPLLAFNLNMLESTNLWDYLLDPVLFVYAIVQSIFNLKFLQTNIKKGEQHA